MKCIYCNATENLTSSDIISYAITGAKLTKDFVCGTHNAYTNDNYEKKFIADISFFRNRLGLLTRDGKPIQYVADVTIDGKEIYGIKVSDKKSLFAPKGVVAGKDDNGKKVLMAPIERLEKIKGGEVTSVDISNAVLHKSVKADEFIGYAALHSVAKMAYEWHCYINNIEEFTDEHKEIVDYILGVNELEMVDIVVDNFCYTALDFQSETGTNSFFEYDDQDGYRYVIFCLWNGIAYRIRICKSPEYDLNKTEGSMCWNLYLYRIDGSKEKKPFGFLALDGRKKITFSVVAPSQMTPEQWKIFGKRLEKLANSLLLSIHILKRKVDIITDRLRKYHENKMSFLELLGYEEEDIVSVLEIISLLHKNKHKYDQSKSFNNNLPILLELEKESMENSAEKRREYVLLLDEIEKSGDLFDYITNGIEAFEEIYQSEMKRLPADV